MKFTYAPLRRSIKRKTIAFNCNSRLLTRGVDGIMKSSSASSRSTRAPACWASLSPGSCWGRPPVSFCHCRGHCNVPWRQWKRRATLPREHDTMTFNTNHCGLLVFICMQLCKGSMLFFLTLGQCLLMLLEGCVKTNYRGKKGPLIEMCVKLRDRRSRHRWNLFNLCQPANHRQLCYTQFATASTKSSERWAYCSSKMCRLVIFFELLSWTDSYRLCSSAHVCWKEERPYCLSSAFQSRFSLSYLVQPPLLLSLLTCRKSFQHRHKSSSGEGFLSSRNINKYVVVCCPVVLDTRQ